MAQQSQRRSHSHDQRKENRRPSAPQLDGQPRSNNKTSSFKLHERSSPSKAISSPSKLARHESSGEQSSGAGQEGWFQQSNRNVGMPQPVVDGKLLASRHHTSGSLTIACVGEEPFHPRRPGSVSSDDSSDTNFASGKRPDKHLRNFGSRLKAVPAERADLNDFRSIIDDLTVENNELKARLKKYEESLAQPPNLRKDALFELRVHDGLPKHRKDDLLYTLQAFASRDDIIRETRSNHDDQASAWPSYLSVNRAIRQYSSPSKSPSGPADSAYVSTSTSGPKSAPSRNLPKLTSTKRLPRPTLETSQTFEGTPAGLVSKGCEFMTDREMKVEVVRRLEHVMIMDKGAKHAMTPIDASEEDSQAGFDQIMKGMREAHILSSVEGFQDDVFMAIPEGGDDSPTQDAIDNEQRPTRPSDLDPNRIQVPSDNINYMRHLGMSLEEAGVVGATIRGWVSLILLFDLAQLHMFHVTSEFVRSAITEISTRFELSPDRQMVRIRSFPEGTRFSSDSENDRGKLDTTTDGDDNGSKRRKIGDSSSSGRRHTHSSLFQSTVASDSTTGPSGRNRRRSHYNDYSALFVKSNRNRRHILQTAYVQQAHEDDEDESVPATMNSNPATTSYHPNKRSDTGTIVFFSGALFVTDLSGDPRDAASCPQPRSVPYDHPQPITTLGAQTPKRSRSKLSRPDSGSGLRSRPFGDWSRVAETIQGGNRPKTPSLLSPNDDEAEKLILSDWSGDIVPQPLRPHLAMEASGIGGTRPEDHFVVVVATSHPRVHARFHRELQTEVAANLDPERRTAKLLQMLEDAKLDPGKPRKGKARATEKKFCESGTYKPPIRITVLSDEKFILEPSEIPPAVQYWGDDTDADDDGSSLLSSHSEIRILKEARLEMEPRMPMAIDGESESGEDGDEEEEEEEDDDDGSIDMMDSD